MGISVLLMGGYLLTLGIEDIRKKEISIYLLFAGVIPVIVWAISDTQTEWKYRLLGLIPGVILLGISVLTEDQIGKADALVLGMMGLAMGIGDAMILMSVAFALCAVVALVLIVFRKCRKTFRLPFIPFIFTGYVAMIVAGGTV